MTTAPAAPAPDLAAVKSRQRATWASGDYASIGALIVPVAENLCDAADLRAGSRVLDVATGAGNAAIAAARLGCRVTGIDYVPALLDRGRERSAAERLDVAFHAADAEDLPHPDGAFDAALSVFGVMFAPDQRRAAAEIARVVRPGGRIGLAAWAPDGFLGDMFRAIGAHMPPPAGLASPMRWGEATGVDDLFGDSVAWTAHTRRAFTFRFRSPDAFVAHFAENYGPTLKAFESLGPDRAPALAADLADLARRWDRLHEDGAIAITAGYLESVGIRR